MNERREHLQRKAFIPLVILLLMLLAVLIYGLFYTRSLADKLSALKETITETTTNYEQRIAELDDALAREEQENTFLKDELDAEQQRNREFETQIQDISSTVGTLDKLARTDPELLQKYSKVYFLNEHYTPSNLTDINEEYTLNLPGKTYQIHSKVEEYLNEMIEDARSNDTPIRVVSAYRSFGTQAALKSQYTVTYGAGTANQFSADQGYSEHQLGTTVDLTTVALGPNFTEFGDTRAYQWLLSNAYKYGFVLSYPEDNAYYEYEPWHWRYVGVDLARELHKRGINFYDMSQREIDEYLINLF